MKLHIYLEENVENGRERLEFGNIKEIHIISAGRCGFPFGFPACAIWFQRNYKGNTTIKEFKEKA